MRINSFWLDGIPITTYELHNDNVKPLIYFFHGFSGNKDSNIMGRGEILANMGFYVVALDAYMHGLRMSELEKSRSNAERYEDIIEFVLHTAEDAKRLFMKYFKHQKQVISNGYHAYGVSMGSLTAFYLGTIDPNLKTIVGLVPTPSFVDYYEDKAKMYGFNHGVFYQQKVDYYKNLDPIANFMKLDNTKIFMGCGIKDEVVLNKYAIKLHDLLPNSTIKFYDTGHVSTKEMLDDSFDFLKKEVL